ncbi:MAG: DUF4259 domain-containing protein [Kofleriaceae bacterium]|jgi:hypothetical protein|nr:DUF4259 domain-containing protein [Kofleriaceae bacterium]MBP9168784.1 DUF4259 domain-containing protein [Kofleriaceae bacterium]MBP9860119.1 DUF4259 domain-containing protein [Kofleriaceae bacterium]
MGTWAAGPFGNDAALDFVGASLTELMEPVEEFLESPEIDETFDPAFAAIALMNAIMAVTPCRVWGDGEQLDGEPIRAAMLACFDEQIARAPNGLNAVARRGRVRQIRAHARSAVRSVVNYTTSEHRTYARRCPHGRVAAGISNRSVL